MHLHLSPDSPAWIRDAAATVLALHIGAGGLGLASGATALGARKGARLHRWAGNVFVVCMITMGVIGAAVAPLLPQRSSVVPGLLAGYLAASAWITVKRPAGALGVSEVGAFLFALAAAATGVMFGLQATAGPLGRLDGDPAANFLVFAIFAGLAAALDLRMILSGGLSGAQRIARHLWRMDSALLLAATSFFLGQQRVFPPALRGSPVLFAPEILIIGLMVFWLVNMRRRRPSSAAPMQRQATPLA